MHFGRFLRTLREDRGLTQTGLADLVGTSLNTIQRGESEQAERCPWRRSMAIKILSALERKLPLSDADAATYLQLAGLEAMARSAAESIRRLRDETQAAMEAITTSDFAARIDDPDTVTAFNWVQRFIEERGPVQTLAAMEGLAAGWSIDLPNRVRRDEMDRPTNMYVYGGRVTAEPPESARRLTVVSPPVQKPGHVEQVFREYEARPPAPLPAAVPPLRKGRPPAPGAKPPRESRKRRPEAPAAWVSATRPFLSRTLRGMIALQRLTAMRPAEVCAIRPCDLRPSRDDRVLIYAVTAEADKLDHLDDAEQREVLLGPRAQRVLRAFWPAEETEYFFSPARAEQDRHAERRARRTLPMWDSHDPDRRARRKRKLQTAAERRSSRTPGDCYTPQSYGKAVKRAALQAAEHEAARGVPERSRTQAWSPYQLRHAGASTLAEAGVPLEVIQRLMGHNDLKTTMNYVHVRERAATKAAAARG